MVEPGNPAKLMGLISLDDLLKARVRRLQEEQRRERILPLRLAFPAGARWRRTAKLESDLPRQNAGGAKWSRITNPDRWRGTNETFNEKNAKLVCKRCQYEVPFKFRCQTCGSSKFVLATAALAPGIFCSICHKGQWHWDCPRCGRRQHFSQAFFCGRNGIEQRRSRLSRPLTLHRRFVSASANHLVNQSIQKALRFRLVASLPNQ